MSERVKELRNKKKLTLEQFGDRVGVTKQTISRIENGVNNLTEQMIKSICREFNVREEWLRNGIEPMESENNQYSLDELVKSKNATDFELEIIKIYFELNEKIRQQVAEHFKQSLAAVLSSNDDDAEDDNILQAAHRRTDIEVTKDMDDFDNAIMDDKNF